ncbi:MAG: sugar ABC transporter ATP-binding protein [bacterium]|nr:sugar ABC transporter ATP-binding protein [bacterium]
MGDYIIEVKNISKNYGGVKALTNVSFGMERGRIHALLGENGAGKSTLIRSLSGVEQPSSGEIIINGKKTILTTPTVAHECGISTVYQEPMQMKDMSVAENIYISRYPKKGLLLDKEELYRKTQALIDEIGVNLNPSNHISGLSVAMRQMVEIIKALSFHTDFIIFDEPTSSLSIDEVKVLYRIIHMLKDKGITILYVSHRMEEIFDLCDDAIVLRDGTFVGKCEVADVGSDDLIHMMVGRDLTNLFPKVKAEYGDEVLRVDHLNSKEVHDVSFSIRKGEVLGFGGLVGAGRTEVMRALFGIDAHTGDVYVENEKREIKKSADAVACGISMVPEDRKDQGMIKVMSVGKNITLVTLREYLRMGFLNEALEKKKIDQLVDRLRIKTPSALQLVGNLSGGNQQKVIFAKWLAKKPRVLILDEPTKGVDVGAKTEIYEIINEMAAEGIGIIMISSDMPELIAMSDRILIMKGGKVSGELNKEEFNEEAILKLAI